MTRISWIQNGLNYRKVEGEISNLVSLNKGIYNVGIDRSGWFLEKTADEFVFPYKIYGLESKFVQHVLTTFNNTKGNLGILLNGIKGTGKSVTAKDLANKMNLPVIIVKNFGERNQELIEFLSGFNFDCIFFFDEFEKNFDSKDSSILQIMDGVYTSNYRRIFLLTTNEISINDNLICRPSRIRYIHEFKNIGKDVAKEYLKDNLKDTSVIEEIISFIDSLQVSTIDILKSICEEVNIFGMEEFLATKKFFNIKNSIYAYDVYKTYVNVETLQTQTYSIDDFLEDVETHIKMRSLNPRDFESEEEYENTRRKFCPRFRVWHDTLSYNERPFSNFKLDTFLYDSEEIDNYETIIKVDKNRNVFVTFNKYDNCFYYYKINNPKLKPSLYGGGFSSHYSKMVY